MTSGEAVAPSSAFHCDLCGAATCEEVLVSPRLDGPLVRCVACGFHCVAERSSQLAFGSDAAEETTERIVAANAEFQGVERDEERRLNEANARLRVAALESRARGPRLLEVGCARGDFLRVAAERFDVSGVEPNPDLAVDAQRVARVHQGLVADLPADDAWSGFDVVASFHVLEHVASPRAFVGDLVARLKPGGLLVLETPDIGAWPFRLLGPRWRQLIPEHYFFFDRDSLTRVLEGTGLRVEKMSHVGKYASPSFLLNRLGRQIPVLKRFEGVGIPGLVRINPGDILLALARHPG